MIPGVLSNLRSFLGGAFASPQTPTVRRLPGAGSPMFRGRQSLIPPTKTVPVALVRVPEPVLEPVILEKAFNPEQPRHSGGQWWNAETNPAPHGFCPECREPASKANECADCGPFAKAKYASTQVNVPEPALGKVRALGWRIAQEDIDWNEVGIFGDGTAHITARYGLHQNNPAQVAEVVAGFGPVFVHLGKVGAFYGEGDKGDVLFVEVLSPDLHLLNEKLAELPHTDSYSVYRPHMTLAYLKPGRAAKYVLPKCPEQPCPVCGSVSQSYPRSKTEAKSCNNCHHSWIGQPNTIVPMDYIDMPAVDETFVVGSMDFSTAAREKTEIPLAGGELCCKGFVPDDGNSALSGFWRQKHFQPTFDPNLHPRGQPDNAGKFVDNGAKAANAEPEHQQSIAKPPAEPAQPAAASAESSPDAKSPSVPEAKAPHVGRPTAISLPDREGAATPDVPARYEVRELGSLKPSHNVLDKYGRTFRENADYPQSLQPRDYTNDRSEQDKVRDNAKNWKPAKYNSTAAEATTGPATVNNEGIGINGNSRLMSLQQLGHDPEKFAAYKQHLMETAAHFGIDPKAVEGMSLPTLVRVVDMAADSPEAAAFASAGQGNEAKQQSPMRTANNLTRMISDDMIAGMKLQGDENLSDAVSGPEGKSFRESLFKQIPTNERNAIFEKGSKNLDLTDQGKALVRNMFVLKAGVPVHTAEKLEQNFPAAMNTIEAAVPQLLKLQKDHPESNITPQLVEAVNGWMKDSKTMGMRSPEDVAKQMQQTDIEGNPNLNLSPGAQMMLDHMLTGDNWKKKNSLKNGLQPLLEAEQAVDPGNMFADAEPEANMSPGERIADKLGVEHREGARFGQRKAGVPEGVAGDGGAMVANPKPYRYGGATNAKRDAEGNVAPGSLGGKGNTADADELVNGGWDVPAGENEPLKKGEPLAAMNPKVRSGSKAEIAQAQADADAAEPDAELPRSPETPESMALDKTRREAENRAGKRALLGTESQRGILDRAAPAEGASRMPNAEGADVHGNAPAAEPEMDFGMMDNPESDVPARPARSRWHSDFQEGDHYNDHAAIAENREALRGGVPIGDAMAPESTAKPSGTLPKMPIAGSWGRMPHPNETAGITGLESRTQQPAMEPAARPSGVLPPAPTIAKPKSAPAKAPAHTIHYLDKTGKPMSMPGWDDAETTKDAATALFGKKGSNVHHEVTGPDGQIVHSTDKKRIGKQRGANGELVEPQAVDPNLAADQANVARLYAEQRNQSDPFANVISHGEGTPEFENRHVNDHAMDGRDKADIANETIDAPIEDRDATADVPMGAPPNMRNPNGVPDVGPVPAFDSETADLGQQAPKPSPYKPYTLKVPKPGAGQPTPKPTGKSWEEGGSLPPGFPRGPTNRPGTPASQPIPVPPPTNQPQPQPQPNPTDQPKPAPTGSPSRNRTLTGGKSRLPFPKFRRPVAVGPGSRGSISALTGHHGLGATPAIGGGGAGGAQFPEALAKLNLMAEYGRTQSWLDGKKGKSFILNAPHRLKDFEPHDVTDEARADDGKWTAGGSGAGATPEPGVVDKKPVPDAEADSIALHHEQQNLGKQLDAVMSGEAEGNAFALRAKFNEVSDKLRKIGEDGKKAKFMEMYRTQKPRPGESLTQHAMRLEHLLQMKAPFAFQRDAGFDPSFTALPSAKYEFAHDNGTGHRLEFSNPKKGAFEVTHHFPDNQSGGMINQKHHFGTVEEARKKWGEITAAIGKLGYRKQNPKTPAKPRWKNLFGGKPHDVTDEARESDGKWTSGSGSPGEASEGDIFKPYKGKSKPKSLFDREPDDDANEKETPKPNSPPPPKASEPAPKAAPKPPVSGDPNANAIAAIKPGQSAFVLGYKVKANPNGTFRVETSTSHVTGTPADILAYIAKETAAVSHMQKMAERALARADAEPDADFFDTQANSRTQAGRGRVPHGAMAVSLDPETRGRIGKIIRGAEGETSLALANSPDLAPADFEPLDPSHSWRGQPRPSAPTVSIAAKPKPAQGRLDFGMMKSFLLSALHRLKVFDESKVHRGQPENAGEFASGGGGGFTPSPEHTQSLGGNGPKTPKEKPATEISPEDFSEYGYESDGKEYANKAEAQAGSRAFGGDSVMRKGKKWLATRSKVEAKDFANKNKSGSQPQSDSVSAKPGPLMTMPVKEFAATVQAVADKFPHGHYDSGVFISDLFEYFKKSDPSLTPDGFKKKLLQAMSEDHLLMERLDETHQEHPSVVLPSRTETPYGNAYHYVTTPNARINRTSRYTPEEKKAAWQAAMAKQ